MKKNKLARNASPKRDALTTFQPLSGKVNQQLPNAFAVLPLLIAIGIVPLIVLLKVIPIPPDYQQFWITEYVFDFFSYYKAQMIIFCAGFILVNALIINHLGQLPRRQFRLKIPLIIYAIMIVLSALFSAHHTIAFSGFFERYEGMWVLLSYLVLMLGAYLFISTLKQLWLIVGVWLAALCIISIIGLFQFIGVDIFQTTAGRFLILPSQYQSIANSLDFNFPKYWIYATLYNPNNVASMMALALPMTAVCFFLSQSKIRRIGFGVLTGLFALVLAGTHARGGWIAVICAALLLFGVFMRHDLLRYWKWLSALSLVAVIAFAVLIFWGVQRVNTVTLDQHHADYSIQVAPEHLSERLIRHYGTLGSGRLYIWIRSLQMARETVLLGRGPDTFALYFPNQDSYKRFFNQPEAFVDKPHNLYIQTWLNLGGLATCAFLAMIILHAVRTFQLLTKAQPSGEFYMLSSGLYAGWFAYLVAAMFYDSVVSVAPAFWIIFGLSLAVNHQLDSAIKSENPAALSI
ncbi:O-antigen ligase [Chromatium okenii]|uniref:O-antigen ligase family protein n=1 Tax=Chromatium okenii TaxID=61644 RepID=UPI0026EE5929|nr:O-antigen ligase family protein [Chromatium okenii]MBV5307828.1 O-antigen ligase family protein [Chromatium okenii]